MNKQKKDNKNNVPKSQMRGLSAGYTLLSSVLIGCFLGYMIDNHYNTSPLWTGILSMTFITAGLYQVVKENWPKEEEDTKKDEGKQ